MPKLVKVDVVVCYECL